MADMPPIRYVAPSELRRMFNEDDYWRRAEMGEFQQQILKDGHPSLPRTAGGVLYVLLLE